MIKNNIIYDHVYRVSQDENISQSTKKKKRKHTKPVHAHALCEQTNDRKKKLCFTNK